MTGKPGKEDQSAAEAAGAVIAPRSTRYALEQLADGRKNLRQLTAELQKRVETKGWDGLTGSYVPCGLAKPRIQEVFAALNRYRG